MSEQHTQERLAVEDATNEDGRAYLTIKGKKLALGAIFNLQLRGNTLNDARRLAACWNACDGISTEHLERHGLPDFAQKISDLVAQRDELLETLKDCLKKGSRWHPCDPVVAKAKAAIAKADEATTPAQRLQEWGAAGTSAAEGRTCSQRNPLMAARYLLCPGAVRSRTDGQLHEVGARQLAMLYGVSMAECVVLPDPSSFENSVRRRLLLDRMVHGELIALHPRNDGDYKLPKSTQEEA